MEFDKTSRWIRNRSIHEYIFELEFFSCVYNIDGFIYRILFMFWIFFPHYFLFTLFAYRFIMLFRNFFVDLERHRSESSMCVKNLNQCETVVSALLFFFYVSYKGFDFWLNWKRSWISCLLQMGTLEKFHWFH